MQNKKAKLTVEQVIAIKSSTLRSSHLTMIYDVTLSMINRIRSGSSWKKYNLPHNRPRRIRKSSHG